MKLSLLFPIALLSTQALAQIANPDLPDSAILTKKYLEEISERKLGQTKFASKSFSWNHRMSMPSAEARGTGVRDIQESDVYKLGAKDRAELFLLNNHRGFQVISFEDGLARPRIVGRVPVHNNWSSEMYYLEAEQKVIVLNTEWGQQTNHWNVNYNTVLYMIDVSDSSAPKIVTELSVPGYLQKSRLVGDVLYAITNSGSWNEARAQITSVKLDGGTLKAIDRKELHGKDSWVSTMNVVQEGDRYFVISTQSNWRSGGDFVNVHDISSSKGNISKLLSARTRGSVSETSQTFIHKGHLFAVSNYSEENKPRRVSVEAFPMKESDEVLVAGENMRVSFGDTNGLHASLQDVRRSGDLLYAFWVPSNNVDPFDLLDISDPSRGIKHLGQLQFEGWISRAFPIKHAGRDFVLGLGHIVPVTSENNRRYPQAKLFEVKKTPGGYRHEVVGSLTLDSSEVFANFNREDKHFEILEEAPGVFNVLFPVTFAKNWKGGAKIVKVDVNSATLSEQASLVGDQGWLKRVFLNRELGGLHAFSNERLDTYDQRETFATGLVKTASTLELARNVVDFGVLSATEGVQVVKTNEAVEMRVVPLSNADAEKPSVLETLRVAGNYEWHKLKGRKLYLITSVAKARGIDTPSWNRVFDHAVLNVVDLTTRTVSSERIDVSATAQKYFYFSVQNVSSGSQEVFTIAGRFYKLSGDRLVEFSVAEDCRYFFQSDRASFSLLGVGGDIYAYNSFPVKASDENEAFDEKYTYSMAFYKKLNLSADKVTCSESVNTPGALVLRSQGHAVVAEAEGLAHHYRDGLPGRMAFDIGHPFRSSTNTYSLRESDKHLELVDILKKDISAGLFKEKFVTYSAAESRLDLWGVSGDGLFFSRPIYLEGQGPRSSVVAVKDFGGRSFVFLKDEKNLDLLELTASLQLKRHEITTAFDRNTEDGSAEFIFQFGEVRASEDLRSFYVSQGLHGVTEISVR